MRITPYLFFLLLFCYQSTAESIGGIDLDKLERPSGITLNSQEILKEQSAKRNVRAALRLVQVGQLEAETEDDFSKLLNQTIDKSDVREAGKKKVKEGEAQFVKAAGVLLEIYTTATERAEMTFEARNNGMTHTWTSKDGRTLNASFISLSDDTITVITEAGDEYTIPLEKLVEADTSVAKIFDLGRGYNVTGFLNTIESGNPSELDYFIDAGFKPPQEIHGEAFLKCIELEQYSRMFQRLIDIGLNINSHSADGMTPLSQAVQSGKLAPVRVLLQAGADPLLSDTGDPALSPIIWSLHKWDPVITTLLFRNSIDKLSEPLSSLASFVGKEYFKPVSLETAKRLQAITNGQAVPDIELQQLKLSLVGLGMTISDLEKTMIIKDMRSLVVSYHNLGFYRHTIRRNQEYMDSLIEVWGKQHEAGILAASYSLGLANLEEWGALDNPHLAEEYLTKAIEGEHTASMILMGEIHENGLLGEVDVDKAYDLYRMAAGQSDPLGMVKVGHCYENGLSVSKDMRKAVVWYERAMENGSTEGMAQLGRCYLNGIGVSKNEKEAFQWYQTAAAKGHLESTNQLAVCYNSGLGVAQNQKKAFELFKKASTLGYMPATAYLAISYAKGLGTTANEDESTRLYIQVINSNDSTAKQIVSILNSED